MDCREASEKLPWLLNRTLSDDEAAAVRAHVEGCGSCREQLTDTRLAGEVYGAHVSVEELVAHVEEPADDLVARHLESCERCREEIELVRESRRSLDTRSTVADSTRIVAFPSRAVATWRLTALAAGIVGLAALAGWWTASQRARGFEAELARVDDTGNVEGARRDRLESELGRQRERAALLERRLAATATIGVNVPIVEALSSAAVLRGGPTTATDIEIPGGATRVVLILVSAAAEPCVLCDVTLRDRTGAELWRASGLERHPTEDYTLFLPVEVLPDGRADLELRAPGATGPPIETFPLRIERR